MTAGVPSRFSSMNRKKALNPGSLSLALVAAAFAAAFCLSFRYPRLSPWSRVLLGGFIGGFTNRVAIRMLFERYRFLPGSGVLLARRDEIINALAGTVETHLINPAMMEEKLREAAGKIRVEDIRKGANALLGELKSAALEYVNSEEAHRRVVAILREKLGPAGKLLDATGIRDIDVMAHDILDAVDEQIGRFEVTEEMCGSVMARTGGLDEFLFEENNPLLVKNLGRSESLARLLFSRFDVKRMVVEKLSRYPAERVRDILEANVREHLGWLELFGVVLGASFSAVFVLVRQ